MSTTSKISILIGVALTLLIGLVNSQGATKDEIIQGIEERLDQQEKELDGVNKQLGDSIADVQRLSGALESAQGQLDAVGKERDGWRDYGSDQHDKWMNAEKRVAEGTAGLLRRNIIIGCLTLLITVYAFAKFYLRVPFI